jgi:hypothetical protein
VKSQQTEKNNEIHELRTQPKDALKPLDLSDVLPVSCWTSSELPPDLREAVRDIARNPGFPVTTKIQIAFDAICRCFKARQASAESELATKQEACAGMLEKTDSLISSLRKAMPKVKTISICSCQTN